MTEAVPARAILMDPRDNVAIALGDFGAGAAVTVKSLEQEPVCTLKVTGPLPYGHKLAVKEIALGEPIIKNGETIGAASQAIVLGEHAHIHNIVSLRVPPVAPARKRGCK